jgi:hypothetical protein
MSGCVRETLKGHYRVLSAEEVDCLGCICEQFIPHLSEFSDNVGLNSSQALFISAGYGVWSLGCVQTPTLAMICSRYLENKDFKPQIKLIFR